MRDKDIKNYIVKYSDYLQKNDLYGFAMALYYEESTMMLNDRARILKFIELECGIDFAEALKPILPEDFSYIPRAWVHDAGKPEWMIKSVTVPEGITAFAKDSLMDELEVAAFNAPYVEVLGDRFIEMTRFVTVFLTDRIKVVHPDAFQDSNVQAVNMACKREDLDEAVAKQLETACSNEDITLRWESSYPST